MTDLRCARCGVPHFEHSGASKDGGLGRNLPWDGVAESDGDSAGSQASPDDVRCPVCMQRRRESRQAAARRYAAIVMDPNDDYCVPVAREQVTFEEVLG